MHVILLLLTLIVGSVLSFAGFSIYREINGSGCSKKKVLDSAVAVIVVGVTIFTFSLTSLYYKMDIGDLKKIITDGPANLKEKMDKKSSTSVVLPTLFLLVLGIISMVLGFIIKTEATGDCSVPEKFSKMVWGTGIFLTVVSLLALFLTFRSSPPASTEKTAFSFGG
jgi:uncharacterized BrkB/YihY/UPF0761 family membrane protein